MKSVVTYSNLVEIHEKAKFQVLIYGRSIVVSLIFVWGKIDCRDCTEKNETDILGSSQFYKGFSQIYYRIYQIF